MKLQVLAIAFLGLFSQVALANQIGPAGCGLGNVVFKKDNQILAATTNGSSYNQLFAITSGTSNCGGDDQMAQMIMFIESNKIALSNEAARGQGETVAALSSLLGCSDSQSFGDVLKSNYSEIFKNRDNSIEISTSIKRSIEQSPTVARSCQHLG